MSKFVEKSYLYDFYGFLSSITGIQSSILKKLQQLPLKFQESDLYNQHSLHASAKTGCQIAIPASFCVKRL